MPTNKELIDDILALDPHAEVEGLTNPKLAALLKETRAKKYAELKRPEIEKAAAVGAKLFDLMSQGNGLNLSAPADTSDKNNETETPAVGADLDLIDPSDISDKGSEIETLVKPETVKTLHVSSGRAITSMRGVLGPGAEVKAEYFAGGEETLKDLVEKGYVG